LVLSPPERVAGKLQAKLLPVEGRVTYLHYEAPKDASTLQVFRNHQAALRRSGSATSRASPSCAPITPCAT
jgi:hypothetical protein